MPKTQSCCAASHRHRRLASAESAAAALSAARACEARTGWHDGWPHALGPKPLEARWTEQVDDWRGGTHCVSAVEWSDLDGFEPSS